MSGYLIAQVNIINDEPYEDYKKRTGKVVKKYGGEFLVRGGKYTKVLGDWDFARTVIIKFASYEKALEWYHSDEYKPIKKIREDNSIGNVIIIQGV
ncbi:MAG: hypothetical protein CFH19_00454 [Alphaproteobacteria bacterium MarineAlpha5_Bin9]|nr:MAG: hypothetical protein CFH19_00454 [Alphaproteobacteria bacterium MarineAlpha5_Bin9]|tara:strand:- start:19974 stop:20261 length:288 start_codon:yes stop_codon:yes gene_type:complete